MSQSCTGNRNAPGITTDLSSKDANKHNHRLPNRGSRFSSHFHFMFYDALQLVSTIATTTTTNDTSSCFEASVTVQDTALRNVTVAKCRQSQ